MKKVEAILSPDIFETIRDILISRGCRDFVVSEVRGAPGNGAQPKRFRGIDYTPDEPRLKLETVVADEDAMATAHVILAASHSVEVSGQMVTVCALERVISIGILNLDDQPIDSRASFRRELLSNGSRS
ncbi:MAG: P-II family nitrogen regulator [Candidatus Binataceae bacterium]